MRILSLLLLPTFLLTSLGCGGAPVPQELRNLQPASVTVTNGGQPMAGIQVTLFAKGAQGAYACNGVTDASGVAQIQTTRGSHTRKGVPAGTYSVVLSESIEIPAELLSQEADQDLPPAAQAEKARRLDEFLSKNRMIPAALTVATTSPVEVLVGGGQEATIVVDVAEHR